MHFKNDIMFNSRELEESRGKSMVRVFERTETTYMHDSVRVEVTEDLEGNMIYTLHISDGQELSITEGEFRTFRKIFDKIGVGK